MRFTIEPHDNCSFLCVLSLSESLDFLKNIGSLQIPPDYESKRIQLSNAMVHVLKGMDRQYPQITFTVREPQQIGDGDDQEEYVPVVDGEGPQEMYEPMQESQMNTTEPIQEDIYDDTETVQPIQQDIYEDTEGPEPIQEDIYDDTDNVPGQPNLPVQPPPMRPPSSLPSGGDPGYASTNVAVPRQTTPEIVADEYNGEDISWEYDVKDTGKKKIKMSNLKAVIMKGSLEKLGGKGQNTWQKRVCVLSGSYLYFYEKETSKTYNNRIVVPVYSVSVDEDKTVPNKNQFVFKLTADGTKNYYFRVSSGQERSKWVTSLETVTQKGRPKQPPSGNSLPQPPAGQPNPPLVGSGYAMLSEVGFQEINEMNQKNSVANPPEGEGQDVYEPFDEELIPTMDSDEEDASFVKETNSIPPSTSSQLPPVPVQIPSVQDVSVDTETRHLDGINGLSLSNVFVAVYEFYPVESDELKLRRGDLVHVDNSVSNEDWWFGESVSKDLQRLGTFGYFPANHLSQAFQVA